MHRLIKNIGDNIMDHSSAIFNAIIHSLSYVPNFLMEDRIGIGLRMLKHEEKGLFEAVNSVRDQ